MKKEVEASVKKMKAMMEERDDLLRRSLVTQPRDGPRIRRCSLKDAQSKTKTVPSEVGTNGRSLN